MKKNRAEKMRDLRLNIKIVSERIKSLEEVLRIESCVSRKLVMQGNRKIGLAVLESLSKQLREEEKT